CSSDLIVLATEKGYVLKYSHEEVPLQSLQAKGVKGINLRDDILVGARYVSSLNKDEILLLTNRGAIKREYAQNIEVSHRPAKGKAFLKSVKTNPYQFVGIVAENIFRLKEFVNIRILTKDGSVVIKGNELKPDRYEHGIPYLEKTEVPVALQLDKNTPQVANRILYKLFEDKDYTAKESDEDSDLDDDVIFELEKIIKSSKDQPKLVVEEDEEDENEVMIQETLF
ncbi:MAG: DNA gyrase C-terminal beta-propeller domain-containing protein, partial [Candidatus Izemoplasmatales bacterium]|nr:DNA gyrase C-terminal beta-propeller domain-containing protein [Candidatus Izemoplasmatales bacterium]